jgi:hypothetical protein
MSKSEAMKKELNDEIETFISDFECADSDMMRLRLEIIVLRAQKVQIAEMDEKL